MYIMSDAEKLEQIGRLAEEYSRLNGEFAHLNERLMQAKNACTLFTQGFNGLIVQDGKLISPTGRLGAATEITGLLNIHETVETMMARDRLKNELQALKDRIKKIAPNLLG